MIKNNIVAKLGQIAIDHSLMCIALSRVRKFKFISLKDSASMNRLCRAIRRHSKIESIIKEENCLCVQILNVLTNFEKTSFVYAPLK